MNIYLASSHRNPEWENVRDALTRAGHYVFDWKSGFTYGDTLGEDIDNVPVARMREWYTLPEIEAQVEHDLNGIGDADLVVLLLPCGADAHVEFGLALQARKAVFVLAPGTMRAGLFYGLADGIFGSVEELLREIANA